MIHKSLMFALIVLSICTINIKANVSPHLPIHDKILKKANVTITYSDCAILDLSKFDAAYVICLKDDSDSICLTFFSGQRLKEAFDIVGLNNPSIPTLVYRYVIKACDEKNARVFLVNDKRTRKIAITIDYIEPMTVDVFIEFMNNKNIIDGTFDFYNFFYISN